VPNGVIFIKHITLIDVSNKSDFPDEMYLQFVRCTHVLGDEYIFL
jgi:hypothetical protein